MAHLALFLVAAAVLAAPAQAQVAGGNPPNYVLEKDGTVVIDGDAETDCRSFASFLEQGDFEPPAGNPSQQAQSVLEQCEEAGLLDSGGGTPNAPANAGADATATADGADEEGSATASAGAEAEALPDTSGVSPAPPTVLLALLLVVAGVAAVRAVRRD